MADPAIDVFVGIGDRDVLAGRLWPHRRRNLESQTFSYAPGYLALPDAYQLDPALKLVTGQQQTPVRRAIFGAFSDCAPDGWGRRVIARRERHRADREATTARSIGETELLLGVRDDLRQGALRFRTSGTETFLADESSGVPALLELPMLLHAAERLERDEASEEELSMLLRGGSSLGGARPKAHVLDAAGRLAIAKFPSPGTDEWDVMRWEAITLELARRAGIDVPRGALHEIDGRSVVIVDRFDRHEGRRIGYVSAMTMLERADGDQGSYLEIADVIAQQSPRARDDLRELWRRMAFSVLVSNFDDHLRNHGFLRTSSSGWSLSPAFDLNPDPRPGERHLSTAIDFDDTRARVDLLLEVAGEFRLSDGERIAVLGEACAASSRWGSVARDFGVSAAEIELMAPAFEHEEAVRAREIARL